jgi:cytochrome c biogenesis protein CcdA
MLAATMLASASDGRGVLAALALAATLFVIFAAVALWKPEIRRAWSHFWLRLAGGFLLIFVLSLFTYGVLHLSDRTALGLLVATFAICAALDWRNRRRNRS